jgi:hypothetical protein
VLPVTGSREKETMIAEIHLVALGEWNRVGIVTNAATGTLTMKLARGAVKENRGVQVPML